MSDDEKPVHTSPEEIVDDHREVAENALTDAIGIVIPGVSSEPSETKNEKGEKEEKEKS